MRSKSERGLKQLPDGRWQFSWCYQGKYHRFKANTKTEARAMREKIKTEIRQGRYQAPARTVQMPFEDAVRRFLEWSRASNRPSTAKGDEWLSGFWLSSPRLAGKALAAITGGDVELFKAELAQRPKRTVQGGVRALPSGRWRATWCENGRHYERIGKTQAEAEALRREGLARAGQPPEGSQLLSHRAVDQALARLKRLFSLCQQWELCERNPAAKVKLFHEDVKRVRFLSQEEETRLLAAASPYLQRIIILALNTGMRRAELLGLRWQDIDARNGVAFIPATRAKGRRDRYIHLNKVALDLLGELPRPIDGAALIFPNTSGNAQTNVERMWRQAVAVADVRDFHFHDLRHTFASRLAMAGVDLAVLRELLGHRDFQMTLRYAHLAPSHLKEAVAVLADPKLHEKLHSAG